MGHRARRRSFPGAVFLCLALLPWFSGCARYFDAFVISKEGQALTVLDYDQDHHLTPVEGSPFPTGIDPVDAAFDPRHQRIYVTNSGEGTLSVYEIATGERLEPLEKIETGETPVAVTVDTRNDLIYVLHQNGRLLPITGKDLVPQSAFQAFYAINPYPLAAGMAYDASHDLLYMLDQADDLLVVLQASSRKYVRAAPTGAKPGSVEYDHRNNRLYVANEEDNTISIYESGPFCQLLETIEAGSWPSDISYDVRNNLLYVAQRAVHRVHVYDAEGFHQVDQLDLPTMAEPVSVATGLVNGASPSLLYVANRGSSNLSVFEIRGPDNHVSMAGSPIGVLNRPQSIAARQTRCPEIVSLTPQEGQVGDTVNILGLSFGDTRELSRVVFGGAVAGDEDIVSWSDTSIEVSVPALAKTGPVRVIVGNACTAPPDGLAVDVFTVNPHAEIYVSAREGDDRAGDGTQENPYKTISHALSQAVPSDVVHIRAGTYDRELGERFPLRVGRGVSLDARYMPTIKYDASQTAVEMAKGSSMNNIRVEGAGPGSNAIGVVCLGDCSITNSVLWKLHFGIRADGEKRPSLIENDISSTDYGIFVTGGANPIVEDNSLFGNDVGINVAQGSTSYIASNDLWENTFIGVAGAPDSLIFLIGNNINDTVDPEHEHTSWGVTTSSSGTLYAADNYLNQNDIGMAIHQGLIRSNSIYGSKRCGIDLIEGGSCLVFENDLRYNGLEYDFPAITVRNPLSIIDSNVMSENDGGLTVDRAGVKVVRNTLNRNESAVTISTSAQIGGSEEEANTITENQTGIWVTGGDDAAPMISHNLITNNHTGVFDCMSAEPRLFHNTIEDNHWGVLAVLSGKPFLGSVEEPGNNVIRNNTGVGLGNSNCNPVVIQAVGNSWNPNVQGSNHNGEYAHRTVIGEVPPEDGNNYAIAGEEAGIEF